MGHYHRRWKLFQLGGALAYPVFVFFRGRLLNGRGGGGGGGGHQQCYRPNHYQLQGAAPTKKSGNHTHCRFF